MRTSIIMGAILAVVSVTPTLASIQPGALDSLHTLNSGHKRRSLAARKLLQPRMFPSRKKCRARPPKPTPKPTDTGGRVIKGMKSCKAGGIEIPVGATPQSKKGSGPNGSLAWLNCGVEANGWNPPTIRMTDLVFDTHLGPIFDPCKPFLPIFEENGKLFNIPTIVLASFAMQESTCNPNVIGGGREQGLFQITPDKCQGGVESEACRDPGYNTWKAAQYFSGQLQNYGGNFLAALGTYNGWQVNITTLDTVRKLGEINCRYQNNLDYLHEFLNGWMQNKSPHTEKLGVYNNLAKC